MRVSRSVMAVGGVVFAAVLIGFTNPKAVRATVTAALVQVTNTAANPVVTQGVGHQAANMIRLRCYVELDQRYYGPCYQDLPDGSSAGLYTVPVGQSLVLNSIEVTPTPNGGACTGSYVTDLVGGSTALVPFAELWTSNAVVTTHFVYPSGVVIGPGISPQTNAQEAVSNGYVSCNAGFAVLRAYGYLTPM